jgi:hypothetical protein
MGIAKHYFILYSVRAIVAENVAQLRHKPEQRDKGVILWQEQRVFS